MRLPLGPKIIHLNSVALSSLFILSVFGSSPAVLAMSAHAALADLKSALERLKVLGVATFSSYNLVRLLRKTPSLAILVRVFLARNVRPFFVTTPDTTPMSKVRAVGLLFVV